MTSPRSFVASTPILSLLVGALIACGTAGCQGISSKADPRAVLAAGALLPSPRLIVGRVIAVDCAQGFVFIALANDAPPAALESGTELIARTLELRDTGRLQVSRYVRGDTLGTKILAGQPSPGDEVVWLAP